MTEKRDDQQLDCADVIELFCKLQEQVNVAFNHEHSADCFCGRGGYWKTHDYDGTFRNGYRNDLHAFEFIQRATRTALEQKKT